MGGRPGWLYRRVSGENRRDRSLWKEVSALFAAALDLPEAERNAWIERATEDRPELRIEIQSLLEATLMPDPSWRRLSKSVQIPGSAAGWDPIALSIRLAKVAWARSSAKPAIVTSRRQNFIIRLRTSNGPAVPTAL